MTETMSRYTLGRFLLIALILQIFRFACLDLNLQSYDLYIDEVYYWGWAQHFDWGYYSKPPMIAWVIMMTTSLFGDTEMGIKIGSMFLYPVTATVIYLIAARLFDDPKIAFYSALAFITLPAVSLSSLIISTDVVLLLFWALSLYFFLRALQENTVSDWVLTGVFAGLGMLSKYNMVFFAVSALLVMALRSEYRSHLFNRKFYLSIVTAAAVFAPNLYWQFTHRFVSFVHTKEISQVERELFHVGKFFEFIGAQFGVFGPLFFLVLLYLIVKSRDMLKERSYAILYLYVIPFLLFISTLSLLSRAFANWGAPIYVSGTVLVVAYLIRTGRIKWVRFSILFHMLLAALLYLYPAVAHMAGYELTGKTDPYKRINGWSMTADEIEKIRSAYPYRLLFNDRELMGEMIYYMEPHPFDSLFYNPAGQLKNQYEMDNSLKDQIGESFIFITKGKSAEGFERYFDEVIPLSPIQLELYKDYSREYGVYIVKGFKGYR